MQTNAEKQQKKRKSTNLISIKSSRNILVRVKDVCFSYHQQEGNQNNIIKNVSFDIRKNELICIIGSNGSGKSTLSKIIGGILCPNKGKVYIDKILISHKNLTKIKQKVGIIFQNPENQFVGTTVYDDIAFGLQNYNVPTDEQPEIIQKVTERLKISHLLNKEPHELSGGQKQMVAVASVFVLKPEVIIFDESTSMIDESSKERIIELMNLLKTKYKKTIISVTHCMDDTINADRVLVVHNGVKKFFLPPHELFLNHSKELAKLSLDVPTGLKISCALPKIKKTIHLSNSIEQFNQLYHLKNNQQNSKFILSDTKLSKIRKLSSHSRVPIIANRNKSNSIVKIDNYSITYNSNTMAKVQALKNLSCSFVRDKINIVVGQAGAGKSTLFQIIDFLIRGEQGVVKINFNSKEKFTLGKKKYPYLNGKKCKSNRLRKRIGLVFQFPEYQLFNLTVLKEVMFSYFNFHHPDEQGIFKTMFFILKKFFQINSGKIESKYTPQIIKKTTDLLTLVRIKNKYLNHNPLELSGGQKRKIAIASVLAYSPKIIMFDEPTAGLDPQSVKSILEVIQKLQAEENKTVILITHDMNLALQIGHFITILKKGSAVISGNCYNILRNTKLVNNNNIAVPLVIKIIKKMYLQKILESQKINIQTIEDLCEYLRIAQS